MKVFTKLASGFLVAVAVALWFTSCSSEEAVSDSNQEKQESVLLLSFNTGQLTTRAGSTVLTDDEKNIEDMTIGIFSSDGTKLRTIQTLTKEVGTTVPVGTGKFIINTDGKAVAKIVTTAALTAGDKVLVAVNAGAPALTAIGSVTAFNGISIDATTALTGQAAGTTLSANKLPKYGESTLQATENKSEFKADGIKVKNLVSKITMSKITVDFTTGGPYAAATFKPTDMFLMSVPEKLNFSTDAWASVSNYFTGKDVADKKDFLTHAFASPVELSITATKSFTGADTDVLYTIPNDNQADKKTVLVLKGEFTTGGTPETVYYPLALNVKYNPTTGQPEKDAEDGTDYFKTKPGKNYKCNIVIKTIGANTPDAPTGPLTATLEVTVEDWSDVDQNATFQ